MPRPADRTPWFKGNTHPSRVGVYERKCVAGVLFSEWDGGMWMMDMPTPQDAARMCYSSTLQNRPWRGLIAEATNG